MHGAAPSTRDAARRLSHRSSGFDEIPAVPYLALRAMMHAIPAEVRRSALVDFGCGVGRVLWRRDAPGSAA